jgi:hypothetical protein
MYSTSVKASPPILRLPIKFILPRTNLPSQQLVCSQLTLPFYITTMYLKHVSLFRFNAVSGSFKRQATKVGPYCLRLCFLFPRLCFQTDLSEHLKSTKPVDGLEVPNLIVAIVTYRAPMDLFRNTFDTMKEVE